MTRYKSIRYVIAATVITVISACGRNEPFSASEPRSPQEQTLKGVFLEFQNGVNQKDADKVAGLIHADASLMVGRDREIMARPEYVKILPKRLAENPSISFGKPKMTVSDETAEVKIYMTRGNYNGLVVYNMKLDNDRWYILNWRY